MIRGLAVLALLVLLAGCGTESTEAAIACEQIINRRVGVELEHRGPAEGATVTGDGPYVVHSAYVEPVTRRITNYACTVERIPDGWRLVDLQTDR